MRFGLAALVLIAGSSTAFANCIGEQALSADELARFRSDPAVYVSGISERELETLSERLAASDPTTVQGLRQAIEQKPLPQQTAITVGLARAAQACSGTNPAQAREIQLVAADLSPTLRTAFERTAGQREVALTGGATGGGGAGGGPTDLQTGSATNGGSNSPTEWSVDNGPTLFTFGGSSGASIDDDDDSSTTTIIGTTPGAVAPVSP